MKTKITSTQLVEIIRGLKGNTFITFESLTEPAQRKTDCPYDVILKLSTVNAATGFDYESNVQNQQVREGLSPDFKAQPRKWGKKVTLALVEHEGKYYLCVRPLKVLENPLFFGRRGNDLIPVKKEEIAPWLRESGRAHTQNTEKEIPYRDYLVSNIRTINVGGASYEVIS
jgi:hypothetical protein